MHSRCRCVVYSAMMGNVNSRSTTRFSFDNFRIDPHGGFEGRRVMVTIEED